MARKYHQYNYQYGTEAPKYPYETYPIPNEEPLRRPKITPKPKRDIGFSIKMGICSCIIFSAAFSFVHLYSDLTVKQSQIKTINTQIRETQSRINSVQAIIAAHLDLEHIQKIATEQLQMSEPLPHQIVYIELPEESYTIYNEEP